MSRLTRLGADLRAVLNQLRQPSWAAGLLTIIVLSVVFVNLGEWQHARYQAKVVRNNEIEANYQQAPVPLHDLLPSTQSPMASSQKWRPVSVAGTYGAQQQLLVRNRPLGNAAGFEVLAPLMLDDGTALVVDRGWVSANQDGGLPTTVPAPPSGRVEVVGRLMASERAVDRASSQGQIQRIDLTAVDEALGVRGYRAYAVLASESPAAATPLKVLPPPSEDLGPHLGYAWQWWSFALGAYGIFGYYLLQEARRRAGDHRPVQVGLPRRRRTSSGPSDEEWEDALTSSQGQKRR